MNKDGINDFIFKTIFYTVQCGSRTSCGSGNENSANVSVATGSNNEIVYVQMPDLAAPLDSLTVIYSSSLWTNNTSPVSQLYYLSTCLCGNYSSYGPWYIAGNVDRYIGLKLMKGTNTYYGWVRLNANTNPALPKLIVKDYAYNSSPNQPILAGQKK